MDFLFFSLTSLSFVFFVFFFLTQLNMWLEFRALDSVSADQVKNETQVTEIANFLQLCHMLQLQQPTQQFVICLLGNSFCVKRVKKRICPM